MLLDELIKHINVLIIEVKESKNPNSKFIVSAYESVKNKLNAEINSRKAIHYSDIDKMDFTEGMKNKLKNVITEFNKNKNGVSSVNNLLEELMNINGIGNEKAHELISNGLKNLDDLKYKKYQDMITLESKLFYKYKPLTKIPNKYISEIENYLKEIKIIDFIIGGSYRRNKEFSSDIDVLVIQNTKYSNLGSSKSNESAVIQSNTVDVFDTILKSKSDLEILPYMRGPDKMSAICKLKGRGNPYVKIDFMKTIKSEYIFMLLYITGSKEFNVKMRTIAKNKGYLLNQKGLYKIKQDKSGNIIEKTQIDVKTEKDIFTILKMEYVAPNKR